MHRLKTVKQKSITCLFTMQILLIFQCLCTIWSNTVTIILIVQGVYEVLKQIVNNANVTNDNNAPSFKYKTSVITNTEANGTKMGVKIVKITFYLALTPNSKSKQESASQEVDKIMLRIIVMPSP